MDVTVYVAVARRRFVALILCLIAGTAGGYYRGHHTPSVFQATSRVLVSQQNGNQNVQESLAGAQLSSSFIETYARVATSSSVTQKVVSALGLSESAQSLQGSVSAGVETSTFIIDISAVDGDPLRAKSIADAMGVALGERVDELEKGKPSPVRAQVLDQAAVPGVPISPHPRSDLLLGIVLGLVAGVALAFLLESLDRTIKSAAQGDAAFDGPMLGFVPRRRSNTSLVVSDDDAGLDSEAYRALRTAVHFAQPDVALRTILVTSAAPGDGKTTTAANLALALAASGQRVALVDADLRRASLAELFGLEASVGLGSLILREVTLVDALQEWGARVTILPAGRPLPPNPSEILGSQFMSHTLDSLSDLVDVVIIDTPPVLPVTDAVVLATQVDAVLLVARHGKTRRSSAAEARRRLEAVGANVIGYVLNAVPNRESSGYYADYRYERTPTRKTAAKQGPAERQADI